MKPSRSCGNDKTGRDLPGSPQIRPKCPARDFSIGDTVDLDGVVLGPPATTALDLVDQADLKGKTALSGPVAQKGPIGGGEAAGEIHSTPNLDTMSKKVNTCLIGLFVKGWDGNAMDEFVDCYPKRPLFKEWVAEAKQRIGATNNAAVAEQVLHVPPSTLNKWLGKSETHKPHLEALKALGGFLGRDYRLLLDDPDIIPIGINPDQESEASKRARVLASAMFQDLLAMPEKEQQIYYELWKKGQEIGRARLAAEAAEKAEREAKE